MNSIDILNAIGDIDDEYVTKAKPKKKSHKKLWIALGSSAAACLALFIGVPLIFAMTMRASAPAPGAATPPEDGVYETAPAYGDVQIFYVANGKMHSITRSMYYDPEKIFYAWRELNGLGSEVIFIKSEIKDNSNAIERVLTNGENTVEYTVGDFFILNLTISKTIENYYDRIDSELLIESLKQTMTGYLDFEIDVYCLQLESVPEFDEKVIKSEGGIIYVEGYGVYGSKTAFNNWRSSFGIGDEVKLLDCDITCENEYIIMNLTVSKELENYYEVTDREKLLKALELIMTSYSDVEFDEYNLTLA